MKVRVESAPSQGEHKASPLLCDGFASRGVHGGKGTFLSLHPDIPLYMSFANKVSRGAVRHVLIRSFSDHFFMVSLAC